MEFELTVNGVRCGILQGFLGQTLRGRTRLFAVLDSCVDINQGGVICSEIKWLYRAIHFGLTQILALDFQERLLKDPHASQAILLTPVFCLTFNRIEPAQPRNRAKHLFNQLVFRHQNDIFLRVLGVFQKRG